MSILLVEPKNYDLQYSINPWMNLEQTVNRVKAIAQWESLRKELEVVGVKTHICKSSKGLPDMIYAANAGMVIDDKKVIISRFKDPERQGEENLFAQWFTDHGYEVVRMSDEMFWEGEACSVIVGDTLLASHGRRADLSAYKQIQKHLSIKNIRYIELIDPYFYHLDVCFSLIDKDTALVCPLGFKNADYNWLTKNIPNIIEVSYDDALNFGCNVFFYKKHVFISAYISDRLKNSIKKRGFTLHLIDVSEFIKSGGGVKCLILNM